MEKKEVEKKLLTLAKVMQKIYLEYLGSLKGKANEIGKQEGYLSVTIWRDSVRVVSTRSKEELSKRNQINLWEHKENPL